MKAAVLLLICSACLPVAALSQPLATKAGIRTERITTSNGSSGYYEYDRAGNTTFYLDDGLHGVFMAGVTIFDSLGREIRSYTLHSNVGYSIQEITYEHGRILHRIYPDSPGLGGAIPLEVLRRLKTPDDLLSMPEFAEMAARTSYLSMIDSVDAAGRILSEHYFDKQGNLTLTTKKQFNAAGKCVLFRYYDSDDDHWRWDIYHNYDKRNNLLASHRIQGGDTSEVYHYCYDGRNNCVYEDHYYNGQLSTRTERVFDAASRLIREAFWNQSTTTPDAVETFAYFSNGRLSGSTITDFRKARPQQKEIYQYRYTYW